MADANGARTWRLPTGVVAGLVFVAALVVLLLLFGEDEARDALDPVASMGVERFEARVAGRLTPITVRPVSTLRVRGRDVVWRDAAERELLATPAMTFAVTTGGVSDGILIHDGVIDRLSLNLVRAPAGTWNYDRILDPILAGGDGDGPPPSVRLRDIALRDGAIRIQFPDALYRATGVRVALASAQLTGPGVPDPIFRIPSAVALLHLPDSVGETVEREVALEEARLRLVDGALAFRIESGRFGSSLLAAAEGVWDPRLGGWGVDATLRVTDGRLADLPWLPGVVPEGTRGDLRLRVESLPGERTRLTLTDATLTAPGSEVRGSVRFVMSDAGIQVLDVDARVDPLALDLVEAFSGPLPYSGDVRGTIRGTGGDVRFDLVGSLAATPGGERFRTDFSGRVGFTDEGFQIREVTTELDRVPLEALRALVPGLPLAGPVTGTVTLDGAPGDAPFQLDVRLEAGGGIMALAGTVDPRGDVPRYDLTGSLVGVELRRVFEPAVPPAQVHAAFALRGAGFDPATAVATVALDGTFTGWESQAGDTVAVRASVDRGLLRAEDARLELGPVQAAASGEWRFAGGSGGAIAYALEVSSLEPLAPYLPPDAAGRRRFARGRLTAEGTLAGTLDAPALAGEVEAAGFRFGEWAADALTGEYAARVGDGLPTVEARFSGRDLRSPGGDFEAATVAVDFTRPDFRLTVAADQVDGGVVEIEAAGLIDEAGEREIQLRRAEADIGEQRWRLPAPARIAWTTGEAVVVEALRLEETDGPGVLRVDGVVAPWDDADFEVEIRRLPTGEVVALAGSQLEISGLLTLEGTVRGPAASPVVALDVLLEDGSLRGVPVRSLTGGLTYADGSLRLDAAGVLGDSARVEVDGTAPARITLAFPPAFELVDGGRLDVRIRTDAFPLATLDPGIRSIRDLTGRLDADVRIGGTPDEPSLAGRVEIAEGALTVPLLDQRYDRIQGVGRLEGRILEVDSLVAWSGGLARLTGRMVFDELTDPRLELTAELDGFRAQNPDDDQGAAALGDLRLDGSLQAPRLTGRVALDDGTLSLAPIQDAPRFSDAFLGADDPFEPLLGPEFDTGETATGGLVVSDLEVVAREDLWFATEEARAQLAGTLIMNRRGEDFSIQGTLQGDQGTFTLRIGPRVTRRFDIVDANIRFFGSPEPNPALDITASRLVRTAEGGDVDVRIRVGGTFQNPTLALAAAEGATVPESELFCFVALARPCTEVTAFSGGTALSDIFALYGLTDLITAELDLPVDYFHIGMRPGQGLIDGLYLTIGEEIDEPLDDVFLLGEFPVGGEVGLWEASLEWRIDRQWTLSLGLEPSAVLRNAATGAPLPEELLGTQRQVLVAIRRRWTY